ncbi:MAG: hypothetical protein R3Y47_12160 [Lachnospiraceae bacterium]
MEKVRLENVDIIDVLQFVVDNNTSHYAVDFEYDKKNLLGVAGEDNHFFWMSRDSGTWLLPERDVFLIGTAAHHTWTSYSERNDSVKAFMVEVLRVSDGRAYGNLTELDYEKHLDYLTTNAEIPKEVQITFRDSMRNFSLQEYNGNSTMIRNRYGSIVRETFLPEQPYLFSAKVWTARANFNENTVLQDVDYYKFNFKDMQFIQYDYHAQDREFVNAQEIEQILKHGLHLYALSKQGDEYRITTFDEYREFIGKDVLFCTTEEERAFLKHLVQDISPLFTEEEYEIIGDAVMEMAKENRIENLIALNSILYKVEHLLPSWGTLEQMDTLEEVEREEF